MQAAAAVPTFAPASAFGGAPTDARSLARRASTQYLMRLKAVRLGTEAPAESPRPPTRHPSEYTRECVSEAGWENLEIFSDGDRVRAGRALFVSHPQAGVHDDATVKLQRKLRLRVGELKNKSSTVSFPTRFVTTKADFHTAWHCATPSQEVGTPG